MKNENCCERCAYWQDYSDRVEAVISRARSGKVRNRIELRRCQFTPHPSQLEYNYIYTDKDYLCGEFLLGKGLPKVT